MSAEPRSRSLPSFDAGTSNGALMTPGEVAARWSVPRSQVYRLARSGELPCVKVGRYVRFLVAAVEAFENGGGADA